MMDRSLFNFRLISRVLTVGLMSWGILYFADSLLTGSGDLNLQHSTQEFIFLTTKTIVLVLFGVFIEFVYQKKELLSKTSAKVLVLASAVISAIQLWWFYETVIINGLSDDTLFNCSLIVYRLEELMLPVAIFYTALFHLSNRSLIAPVNRMFFLFSGISIALTTVFITFGDLILSLNLTPSLYARTIQVDVFDYLNVFLTPITCAGLILFTLRYSEFSQAEMSPDLASSNDELLDNQLNADSHSPQSDNSGILSVDKWIGYELLAVLPVVNIFVLINWCNKAKSITLRKWSVARFRLIAYLHLFILFLLFHSVLNYSENITLIVLVITGALFYVIHYLLNDKVKKLASDDSLSTDNWFGKLFASIVPVYGHLQLISWAMNKDDMILRNWARATLWMIPVNVAIYFKCFMFYGFLFDLLT